MALNKPQPAILSFAVIIIESGGRTSEGPLPPSSHPALPFTLCQKMHTLQSATGHLSCPTAMSPRLCGTKPLMLDKRNLDRLAVR